MGPSALMRTIISGTRLATSIPGWRAAPWIRCGSVSLRKTWWGSWRSRASTARCWSRRSQASTRARELLEAASRWEWVRGVVAWVDLAADDAGDQLDELRASTGGERLVGVRHQVHDEEDPRWLCRAEVRRGLAAVASRGLAYDLLLRAREIPAAIETAQALPEVSFVVDHIAKPRIVDGSDPAWEAGMPGLAALANVQVKLSGMVTEADWTSWTPDDLRPFVSRVVELFGTHRLMFGSDWPVCLLVVSSYQEVIAALEETLGDLSDDESRQVFGANAQRFYGLALPGH